MLPHLAMEAIEELTTILSSKPAGFPSASNLPEIDLFGRRTRLLLIGEPYLVRANAASELRLRTGPSPRLADFLAHLRAAPADAAANLKIMISMEPACWLFMARTDGLKLSNPLVVAGDLAQDRDILASSMNDWLCG